MDERDQPKLTGEEAEEKAAASVSIDKQIACVERELKMRRSVYPRRVADGKMTDRQAAAQTWEMLAVLGTLRKLATPKPKQESLL